MLKINRKYQPSEALKPLGCNNLPLFHIYENIFSLIKNFKRTYTLFVCCILPGLPQKCLSNNMSYISEAILHAYENLPHFQSLKWTLREYSHTYPNADYFVGHRSKKCFITKTPINTKTKSPSLLCQMLKETQLQNN